MRFTPTGTEPTSRLQLAVLARLAVLGVALLVVANASEETVTIDISVRSAVDRPFQGWSKAPVKEHGKLYALIAMDEAPSQMKIVRPVDQAGLAQTLRDELTKRDFREITPGETPDILLTVIYGRGWLRNPYLDDVFMDESGVPPIVTFSGLPTNLMRQKGHRFETKLQAAQYEKLFIRVTAWQNPSLAPAPKPGRKPKPKELWKTTMIVADPDHVDLNGIYKELLAAGAAYFDRQIEEEEVFIPATIPEGSVIMGPLEFLDEEKPARPDQK